MENNAMRDGAHYFPDDLQLSEAFDALADELGGCETLRVQQAMLLCDLVRGEALKDKLREDIVKRGVGGEVTNGRQRYWRDNKSVTTLMKLMEQQRKIMQTLGLIARDANQPRDDDGDEDDFDRL